MIGLCSSNSMKNNNVMFAEWKGVKLESAGVFNDLQSPCSAPEYQSPLRDTYSRGGSI